MAIPGEKVIHGEVDIRLILEKIFHISLVYWRNTALSSLAIHTVWLRPAALSCTNTPTLLMKSFYQELGRI